MSLEHLTALVVFAFVSSITPGPNNLMLMASGANFGYKRSLPHIAGVGIGFMIMVVLIGLGLKQIFDIYPITHQILKFLSITYLSYLAFGIATASPPEEAKAGEIGTKPLSFIQAALFQWVNPKAWTMALTAVSVYSPSASLETILLIALAFGAVNFPCVSTWTLIGREIKRLLTNKLRQRIFNIGMAVMLLLSMYPVLFS